MNKCNDLGARKAILFVNAQKVLHVCQQGQWGDVMALRILQEVGKRCGVSANQDAQVRKTLAERRQEARARVAQKWRRTLCGQQQMATDTRQTCCSYLGICCLKHEYLVFSYPCSVLVRARVSWRGTASSRTAFLWRPARRWLRSNPWPSGLPGQRSFARRCTRCWCSPSSHKHGDMNTRCDVNGASLAARRAHTYLQADRQQGGSDCVPLCSAGGPLVGPLSLVCHRLLLLATVQQHRLDAVSISQEERVALTGRHVPNPKAIRQLQSHS